MSLLKKLNCIRYLFIFTHTHIYMLLNVCVNSVSKKYLEFRVRAYMYVLYSNDEITIFLFLDYLQYSHKWNN